MAEINRKQRPLDRSPYYVDHNEHLDRVLNRPQLTGIGISGTIGVGIYVTSGQLITASGSIGAPLSYLIAGIICACVMYTLTEMVASRPLTGALIDLPHHFWDPAAGFAVSVSYSLANIFSMATLTAYSAELTALLKDNPTRHPVGVEVGINIALIAITTLTHCLGVKLYGRLERVVMVFKLSLFVLCCVLMLIVNVGGAGPRTGSYRSNYTTYAFPPGFKPMGFNSTSYHSMHPSGVPDTDFGIPGAGGRLFAFLTTVTLAMFSCSAGEMTAMTAGESKEPWKDVPVVMSFVYIISLALYPFVLMSAAANVNYSDPSLPLIWGDTNGAIFLSPFIIAIQTSALRSITKMMHVFFIVSAYTAGNTALYVSSRSVFMLAQTYLNPRLADIFGKTNNGHTPLAAILLCSAFGFISLTGLGHHAYSQPRQTMSAFYTGTLATVYICECVTFLKFKAGLKSLEDKKILSRNEELYMSRMFRSRWQPLPAYIGIVGCSLVIIWSGIPALWILCSRREGEGKLKSNVSLGCDVLGAWIGPILFVLLYLGYKYITPGTFAVEIGDLTPSDYILADLSSLEGENPPPPTQNPDLQQAPSPYSDPNATNQNSNQDCEANIELDTVSSQYRHPSYQSYSHSNQHIPPTSTATGVGANFGLHTISPVSSNNANNTATAPAGVDFEPDFNDPFAPWGTHHRTHSYHAPHPLTHTVTPPLLHRHSSPTQVYTNGTVIAKGATVDMSDMGVIEEDHLAVVQRARIIEVLKKRPKMMERGFWREIWKCFVADSSQEAS